MSHHIACTLFVRVYSILKIMTRDKYANTQLVNVSNPDLDTIECLPDPRDPNPIETSTTRPTFVPWQITPLLSLPFSSSPLSRTRAARLGPRFSDALTVPEERALSAHFP